MIQYIAVHEGVTPDSVVPVYATRDPEATYEFYSKKLGMPLLRTENHRQGD